MKLKHLSITLALTGCAAHHQAVLERSDDLSSRPEWATINRSIFERDGRIYFVGFVEVNGAASKSGALNMSDEKALSEPLRALVEQFIDQNQVGEELVKDEEFGRRIISATRGYRPPITGLKISHRYWEKVASSGVTASTEIRAFSVAEMTLADFEDAKRAYLAHLRKDPEIKRILDDIGSKQLQKVLTKAN